jgi:hypothetical protein
VSPYYFFLFYLVLFHLYNIGKRTAKGFFLVRSFILVSIHHEILASFAHRLCNHLIYTTNCNRLDQKTSAFVVSLQLTREGKEGLKHNWNEQFPISSATTRHQPRHRQTTPTLTLVSCTERSNKPSFALSAFGQNISFKIKTDAKARKTRETLLSFIITPAYLQQTHHPTDLCSALSDTDTTYNRLFSLSRHFVSHLACSKCLNVVASYRSTEKHSSCCRLPRHLSSLKGALAQTACSKCSIWKRSSISSGHTKALCLHLRHALIAPLFLQVLPILLADSNWCQRTNKSLHQFETIPLFLHRSSQHIQIPCGQSRQT